MRFLPALALLFWSTAAIADPDAFSRPLPFLSDNDRATVHLSNSLFRKSWRPAPSATTASDGLGPLYNARSCADCHFRDGRGRPPNTGERALSLLLRLAPADPIYGRQLQNNAVDGHQPEGQVRVRYVERTVMLSGGEVVRLRKPIFGVEGETYGPLAPATQLDPRLAPPVFGLGLLEAISEQDILAGADPQDRDGDGISGRSATVDGAVGRFGWKADNSVSRTRTRKRYSSILALATAGTRLSGAIVRRHKPNVRPARTATVPAMTDLRSRTKCSVT